MRHGLSIRVFLVVFGSLFVFAQADTPSGRIGTSFFIANDADAKTGKRLIDQTSVLAFAQTRQGRLLFTQSGASIAIEVDMDPKDVADLGKTEFVGAERRLTRISVITSQFVVSESTSKARAPRLSAPLLGAINFLVGPKERWRTGVTAYSEIVYDDVWNGIDVIYRGVNGQVELCYELKPGAEPSDIRMSTGAERLALRKDGSLAARLSGATLNHSRPIAFQLDGATREEVEVKYKVLSAGNFGFDLGHYDRSRTLFIDPVLSWSTYLGGPGGQGESIFTDVSVDSAGNIYVCGFVSADDFPTTPMSYSSHYFGGASDAFVGKFSPDGSQLIYGSFLGGSRWDQAHAIQVDTLGRVVVAGFTTSADFPVTPGVVGRDFGGVVDVFVTKFSANGEAIEHSSYLGGGTQDRPTDLVLDAAGFVYLAGNTGSSDFPTTPGAYDEVLRSSYSGFVTKLSPNLSSYPFSTFVSQGGSVNAMALDSSGSAYITGGTGPDLDTTPGVFDPTYNAANDAYVTKLNASGSALEYSTFLGGDSVDEGLAISVDGDGNCFVAGTTNSTDFPATLGVFDSSYNAYDDIFVTKLNHDGSVLEFATYLGGEGDDRVVDLELDFLGRPIVVGTTSSPGFPTTPDALKPPDNPFVEAFITKLSQTAQSLEFSSLLGGQGYDHAYGVAVKGLSNLVIVGSTT